MEPLIDHIQITVRDMDRALEFYDQLMPILGFDASLRSRAYLESHDLDVAEYKHPSLCFAINSPRSNVSEDTVHRRRPGSLHHLAFRAASRQDVDRVHSELVKIDAPIVAPPREYPEYVPPGYYAVFFKDLDGIKFEVVHY